MPVLFDVVLASADHGFADEADAHPGTLLAISMVTVSHGTGRDLRVEGVNAERVCFGSSGIGEILYRDGPVNQ